MQIRHFYCILDTSLSTFLVCYLKKKEDKIAILISDNHTKIEDDSYFKFENKKESY